ncbi:MAG: fibronectin type III domain-containing protein [Salegentibacter sp.]|uniref:fibronectin type III domain-containing protein n=1 Tax=Salegentibacter sp. TaxID=1903072 RepID=UPI002870739D|nr:fibronectin type III domain-containing protein [Salegentibacter sp.]MDR9458251.1 fibronectin type III domain-containing protein [Salegentibacter sp.]
MKINFSFSYIFISLLIMACSGEKIDDPVEKEPIKEKPANKAPSAPKLLLPVANLACSFSTLNFEWETSTDPEGKEVSYKLEISESEDFKELFDQRQINHTSVSLSLEKGSTYYWKVQAIDQEGARSDYSEIRSFFTEPSLTYNSIPQNPNSETPSNNSTVDQSSVLLEWSSKDEDGDSLKFDIYFGTTEEPPLYEQDLVETSFEVNLNNGTTYFWQVVAKDDKGAGAIGPIWTFSSP